MVRINSEKGQALVIIVLAIVGLIGLTALTIDGGNAYSDRRNAQNSADTAVLAASLAKIRGQDWEAAGLARAADNGYDDNKVTNVVQVVNPPVSGVFVGDDEYIQVLITSHVNTFFAPVLGIRQITNRVSAVARATSGGTGPLFDGAALVTLKEDGTTFTNSGNPNLDVINSGVFVNSSSDCAMYANGNIDLEVDTAYSIVGTLCQNGTGDIVGPVQSASQIPYPPDINFPPPTITCSGNGTYDAPTKTFTPGNYNGIAINANGSFTFLPGNYCFNGDVRFNGNVNITANDVNFRLNSGEFVLNLNQSLTCNNFLFYSAGGTGMHVNGTSYINCTNATFYMLTGDVLWNGTADQVLTAPTSGPYANLLIFMPYGNDDGLLINGNSNSTIQGSIIAIQSDVEIVGNSTTLANQFASQIIGYTITLSGNGDLVIDYDPGENVVHTSPANIELAE